jgi:signal recognition particle subunit SRP54
LPGWGEKLAGIEEFHPERMASRILGMGDILGLVEEAQRGVDQEKAREFAQKLKSGKSFDLNDYREQITQMRKMGGLGSLLEKLPAQFAQAAQKAGGAVEDKTIGRIEGIINSMTPSERSNPDIIKASRKRRIATGAGVSVQEVNRMLSQFEQMQKMMKQFSKGGMQKLMRGMRGLLPGMR